MQSVGSAMGAIYLIRHAQASFGAADYDRLSDLGQEQARVLGAALGPRLARVDVVVAGAMRRHHQTAAACLEAMGARAVIDVDAGWDEYDHDRVIAAFEPRYRDRAALAAELGRSDDPRRAFQRLFAAAVARWVGGAHDADYDEGWAGFRARVGAALGRIAARVGKSQTALVFTSGGPIAAVAGELLGVADERRLMLAWTLANGGLSKLLCRDGAVQLSTLNEHQHFEAAGRRLLTYR
jgi:broad specificity phosphatase PhoE